jgi:xylulokinase
LTWSIARSARCYCVDALTALGLTAPGITLVGGGAIHPAWQAAVADVTDLPVFVRSGTEHAARGAAVQAAAMVLGEAITDVADRWRPPVVGEVLPRPGMREAFALNARQRMIQELIDAPP